MTEEFIKEDIQIPDALAKEINLRIVRAMRVNIMWAMKKHKNGESYAMANQTDVAIKAWLMTQMRHGCGPREAIEMFMEFLTECVLPDFVNIPQIKPEVMAEIRERAENPEQAIIQQVNDMLVDAGLSPIVCAGTLDEIIEQLNGLRDSQGKTKQ
jgi:hypothetical protein